MLDNTRINRLTPILEDLKRLRCKLAGDMLKVELKDDVKVLKDLYDILHVCEFVRRK